MLWLFICLFRSAINSILSSLETGLLITLPDHIYDIVVKIFKHSIDLWKGEKGKQFTRHYDFSTYYTLYTYAHTYACI